MSFTTVKCLAVAALAGLCASCGGGGGYSSSSPSSPSSTPTTSAVTINIIRDNGSQSFSPNPASAGGQMVVFKNTDTVAHRVVLNDGTLDTGIIQPGASSAAVLMPGTGSHYHCTIHPDMVGSVNSSSGAAAPPDSSSPAPGPAY